MCIEHQQRWKGYGHQYFWMTEFCNHLLKGCRGPGGLETPRPIGKEHEGICPDCIDRLRRERGDQAAWKPSTLKVQDEASTEGYRTTGEGKKRQREEDPSAVGEGTANKKRVRIALPEEGMEQHEYYSPPPGPPPGYVNQTGLNVPRTTHQGYRIPPPNSRPSQSNNALESHRHCSKLHQASTQHLGEPAVDRRDRAPKREEGQGQGAETGDTVAEDSMAGASFVWDWR
jgi:hypothetical protein